MMNFEDWPVVDVAEFEFVEIDVTRWGNVESEYEYTIVLNFYRTVGENDEPNTGFTICTHIGGQSLDELHSKITMMVEAGLLDGTEVQAMGTLYDEEHRELGTIDWNSFEAGDEDDLPSGIEVPKLVVEIVSERDGLDGFDIVDLGIIHRAPNAIQ